MRLTVTILLSCLVAFDLLDFVSCECKDASRSFCSEKKSYCKSSISKWQMTMKRYCSKTCGFCKKGGDKKKPSDGEDKPIYFCQDTFEIGEGLVYTTSKRARKFVTSWCGRFKHKCGSTSRNTRRTTRDAPTIGCGVKSWKLMMTENCPKTCGFCERERKKKKPSEPSEPSDIYDTNWCEGHILLCDIRWWSNIMKKNCAQTCGSCPSEGNPSSSECKDNYNARYCKRFEGDCASPYWIRAMGMINGCARTCGICRRGGDEKGEDKSSSDCRDRYGTSYCILYKKWKFCNTPQPHWKRRMFLNCPKTCGFCKEGEEKKKPSEGEDKPSSVCQDTKGTKYCAKRINYCTTYWKQIMKKGCAKTCGTCKSNGGGGGGGDKKPSTDCKDKRSSSYCTKKKKHCTSKLSKWKRRMKNYCAKTCNLCGKD